MMHSTSTVWIDLSPGVRAEVEYEDSEYRMSVDDDEGELPARLTGRIYITAQTIQDAE